jgi:hypothetical protein
MSIVEVPVVPPASALLKALERAVNTPAEVVLNYVEQSRRSHPGATPAELCAVLDRRYLATVTASGASSGAAAAAPGVGTAISLALAGADAFAFIGASALLALSYAEIHRLAIEDLERRRTLVLAVVLGDSGIAAVTKVAERTGRHLGRTVVASVPMTTIRQVNRVLGRNFITKYGTKQGILVLGKSIPFGIGLLIGAGGNHLFGRATVKAARLAFGDPPPNWPEPDGSRVPSVDGWPTGDRVVSLPAAARVAA